MDMNSIRKASKLWIGKIRRMPELLKTRSSCQSIIIKHINMEPIYQSVCKRSMNHMINRTKCSIGMLSKMRWTRPMKTAIHGQGH